MKLAVVMTSANEEGSDRLFRTLMKQVAVVAGLTHVAFGCLFYWHNVPWLALVNVFSVALYVLVFALMRNDRNTFFAWSLVVVEIIAHALLAVFWVGWNSGFHFYLMLIPPVMMVSPLNDARTKMPAVVAMVACYVLMDYFLRQADATFYMPAAVLDSLYYFNLVAVLVIMAFLAWLYYRLVVHNERQLKHLATTDPLTGLHNRRSLSAMAQTEIEHMQSLQKPMAALLCDLDHFKQINDSYGHHAGDDVLKAFAQLLLQSSRHVDLVSRWGGEEFLLLLPGTAASEAKVVAERIRQRLVEMEVDTDGQPLKVSTTIGIAELRAGDSLEKLLARADEALYRGKAGGRNQVATASAEAP